MVRVLTSERSEKTAKQQEILFTFEASSARSVYLTGNFNRWSATENPMRKDRSGTWTTRISLKPGNYQYKFVIDGTWQEDPRANASADNPFGTRNSIITVR